MRIFKYEKVMRSLQVLLLLLPLTAAFPCKLRHQFWDATLGSCVDCTKCNRTNQVVLRPCQVHQDTFCGPLSALDIDWSWLKPHKHHSGETKTKHHHHRKHPSEATSHVAATSDTSKEVVLSFAEDVTLHREHVTGDGDQLQAAQRDKHKTPVTSNTKHSHERPQNSSWLSTKHHKHAAGESFSEMEDRKLHWTTAEAIQLLSPHRSSNRKNHEKKHRKQDQQHVMWSSEGAESEDEAMRVIEQELMASSSTTSNSEVLETSKHSHHHHHHRKQTNSSLHKGHHNKNKHAHHHKTAPTPEPASQLQVLNLTSSSTTTPRMPTELESLLSLGRVPTHEETRHSSQEDAPSLPRAEESAVSPEPFSATESLIWDGQAVILALAVFACLLFFLVAAIYSIHHARQWTRLKENFEADVEELSARLSLMTPGNGAQQADITTTSEGSNANLQCVYLEQLLVRKQQEEAGKDRGNVYIDRDTGKKSPK